MFLSPFFYVGPNVEAPTEETAPPAGFVTFPLTLSERAAAIAADRMSPQREAACAGHHVDGALEHGWEQSRDGDVVGRNWGGTDPNNPAGLLRSPTFSTYGWNSTIADS